MPEEPMGKNQKKKVKPAIAEMKVAVGEGMRRLPIYLLLDTSGSMASASIEAVRQGVEHFRREVENDTFANDTVHVGVITFGGEAEFVTHGLVPVDRFQLPAIHASGETPLGQAFYLLQESLDKDVRSGVKGGEKGDWKPVIFVLTDGQPTDQWRQPRDELLKRQSNKVIDVITVGCGPGIDPQALKDISIGKTFNMESDGASFKAFFQWVTQSVITKSREVSRPGEAKPGDAALPPDQIQYVP